MDQLLWLAVIAVAMVFGWYLHQKYSGGGAAGKGSAQAGSAARPTRKKRPRKRS